MLQCKVYNLLIFTGILFFLLQCGSPTRQEGGGLPSQEVTQQSPATSQDITPSNAKEESCYVELTATFEGQEGKIGTTTYDSTFKKYMVAVTPPRAENGVYRVVTINMKLVGCVCEVIEWSTGDVGRTSYVTFTRASPNRTTESVNVRCDGRLIAVIDFIIQY